MLMPRKKLTHEEAQERIDRHGRGIVMVGDYVNAKTKTTFQCSEGHEWDAKPDNVMQGDGCPHCAGNASLSKEIWNERLKDRNIKMVGEYLGALTKTTFQCLENHTWNATPNSVMKGSGCPTCAIVSEEQCNERLSDRCIKVVGDYVNTNTKTTFQCLEGHEWETTPASVLHGSGCPTCATTGFDPTKPAILYYLRIDSVIEGTVFKIGITNNTVQKRFSNTDLDKITVLSTDHFDVGADAKDLEKLLLCVYQNRKHEGETILESSGNTEILTQDVRRLDPSTPQLTLEQIEANYETVFGKRKTNDDGQYHIQIAAYQCDNLQYSFYF